MRELKIDPEFRDLLPPLSGEEKKQLENSLLKTGYVGAPIYIWNDYIVDGHNRYDLCRKNKIDYPVEDLILGDKATKIDVMEWMINTQLGRRNLPPAQRLAVVEKFRKKIQENARENQSLGGGDQKSENRVSPIGEKRSVKIIRTHTDKELAKMAGVGTGTVARYNRVMNSDDKELKKKVLTDEMSINAAYEKIRNSEGENKSGNILLAPDKPQTYKEATKMFGGTQSGHFPNRKYEQIEDEFTDEQLVNALITENTPVNVYDSIVPKQEFDIMIKQLLEGVTSCDYRIFDLHKVNEKMNDEDVTYAIDKFDFVISEIRKLEQKIKSINTVKGE